MEKRYIKKLDMHLSPLGFGVMRLPMDGNRFTDDACRLMRMAMESGINYYDTAYPYQKECSEEFIRNTLVAKYPRHMFHIADKMPVWLCDNTDDMERIFQTQLERLGVDYIDMYLLHALNQSQWQAIYEKGVIDFLDRKKKEGKIRKTGFSLHDTKKTLVSILDAFNWDFVQLQINYYDWTALHAKESYDYLVEQDIPCIIMEPVGGGRLSKLPNEAEKLLKDVRSNSSISSWALRYVASLSNVAVTLSGMSDKEQLIDNIMSFDPIVPMTGMELETLDKVLHIIRSRNTIPCTSCGYCIDECPKSIDIPNIFQRYNEYKMFGNSARFDIGYFGNIPSEKMASACVACGKCAKKCPQKINISQKLRMVHDMAIELYLGISLEELNGHLNSENDSLLVCFGTGSLGKTSQALLSMNAFKVNFFCDNTQSLWGSYVNDIPVISPKSLKNLSQESKVFVLITSSYYDEIKAQLDELGISSLNIEK